MDDVELSDILMECGVTNPDPSEGKQAFVEHDLFFRGDYAFCDEEQALAALQKYGLHRSKSPGVMQTRLMILACALAYSSFDQYLAYCRHNARYTGMQRYFGPGYGYRRMIEEMAKLTSKGLLHHIIEPVLSNRNPNPRQSSFKATQIAIDDLGHLELRQLPPEFLRLRALFEIGPKKKTETLVFKKVFGRDYVSRLVGYEDDDHTQAMRDVLVTINEHLSKIKLEWIGMSGKTTGLYNRFDEDGVLTTKLFLTRSFCRKDFELYGRFHGFWQNQKFWSRQQIRLNGEETCEPDFSQFHLNMLYLEMGLTPPEEGYRIEGFDRDLVKNAFPTLLNAANVHAAQGAIASAFKIPKDQAAEVIRKFSERHPAIAGRLHSDYGVTLMYKDSQICEKIMLALVTEGIAFLPIHDGFRVPKSSNDRVVKIMKEVFASFYTGFDSPVKTKGL